MTKDNKTTNYWLEHDANEEFLVETAIGRFHICVERDGEILCVCPVYQSELYRPLKIFRKGQEYEARERINGACIRAVPHWSPWVDLDSWYNNCPPKENVSYVDQVLRGIWFKGSDGKSYSAGEISIFHGENDPDRTLDILQRKPKNYKPNIGKSNSCENDYGDDDDGYVIPVNHYIGAGGPYSKAADADWDGTGW